jgi:hypothetical protein
MERASLSREGRSSSDNLIGLAHWRENRISVPDRPLPEREGRRKRGAANMKVPWKKASENREGSEKKHDISLDLKGVLTLMSLFEEYRVPMGIVISSPRQRKPRQQNKDSE